MSSACLLYQLIIIKLLTKGCPSLGYNANFTNSITFAAGSFQEQLSSYIGQLGSSDYQKWVIDAIEKEKLKQQHLKVVINHLESEVSNLAQETVNQMENSMTQVRQRKQLPSS